DDSLEAGCVWIAQVPAEAVEPRLIWNPGRPRTTRRQLLEIHLRRLAGNRGTLGDSRRAVAREPRAHQAVDLRRFDGAGAETVGSGRRIRPAREGLDDLARRTHELERDFL